MHDRTSGYDRIEYPGLRSFAPPETPGVPLLPVIDVRALLPPGHRVASVRVLPLDPVRLPGDIIPRPSDGDDEDGREDSPDSLYYQEGYPYPSRPEVLVGSDGYKELEIGNAIAIPFTWDPMSRSLLLFRTVKVAMSLERIPEGSDCPRRERPERRFSREGYELQWARENVINPEDIELFYPDAPSDRLSQTLTIEETNPSTGFHPTDRPSLQGPPVDMIILTNPGRLDHTGSTADMVPVFQGWADWRTQTGLPTVVRTVEWVRKNYDGADDPARIRAFLMEAYRLWGTDYLLIGGDVEIVPARMKGQHPIIVDTPNKEYPAAWYYAGFDKPWADLTHPYYYREEELYPELWVGRIPARDADEATAILNKMRSYERVPGFENPAPPSSFYTKAVLFAGLTNFGGWEGDTGIGHPTTFMWWNGVYQSEQLRNLVLTPAGFTSYRLYPKLEFNKDCAGALQVPCYKSVRDYFTANGPFEAYFTPANVYSALKTQNPGVVFHVEHSFRHVLGGLSDNPPQVSPTTLACTQAGCTNCSSWQTDCFLQYRLENPETEHFTREMLSSLSNGPSYFIGLSYGSMTNMYSADSVDEALVRDPDGGAVAWVGKPISPNTYGEDETEELSVSFFDWAILDRNPVGVALVNALIAKDSPNSATVWQLLGDPSLRAWSAVPPPLHIASTVTQLGNPDFYDITITVRETDEFGPLVEGARVCLSRGTDVYALGFTNASGEARFPAVLVASSAVGIDVRAVADNKQPGYFFIEPVFFTEFDDTPTLIYKSHKVGDAEASGAHPDIFEPGDRVRVRVKLHNVTPVTLPPGSALVDVTPRIRVALRRDNVPADPLGVWIGRNLAHPPGGQDTFSLAINEYGIRPEDFPVVPGPGSKILIWREGPTMNYWIKVSYDENDPTDLFTGVFIAAGGLAEGTVETLEPDDVVTVIDGPEYSTLSFAFHKDAESDAIEIKARGLDWVDWVVQEAAYGSVAPNDTTSCVFKFDLRPGLPPRTRLNFTIGTRIGEVGVPPVAFSDFFLNTSAPSLALALHRVQSAVGGGCACPPGTSEYRLIPSLINLGDADATNVQVALEISGSTASICPGGDVVTLNVPAGEEAAPSTGFAFCDALLTPTLRVERYVITKLYNGIPYTFADLQPNPNYNPWPLASTKIPSNLRVDAAPDGFRATWGDIAGVSEVGWHVYVDSSTVVRRLTRTPIAEASQSWSFGQPYLDVNGARIDYRVGVSAVTTDQVEGPIRWSGIRSSNLSARPGWPKRVPKGPAKSVMLVDLDNDTDLEVLVGGRVMSAWNPDGSSVLPLQPTGLLYEPFPDAQVDDDRDLVFFGHLAAANIDGDTKTEIAGSFGDTKLHVIQEDGSFQFLPKITNSRSTPTLANIDQSADNSMEILVSAYTNNTLYAFKNNGLSFKIGSPDGSYAMVLNSDYNMAGVAVANVQTGVPGLEIAHSLKSGSVNLLKSSTGGPGAPLWTGAPCNNPDCSGPVSTPVIADMNNDDIPDVVAALGDTTDYRRVGALNGSAVNGGCLLMAWRGRVVTALTYNDYHEVWTSKVDPQAPSVAELNTAANGIPEVVMGRWTRPQETPDFKLRDRRVSKASLLTWRSSTPPPCGINSYGHISTLTDSVPIPGRNHEIQGATLTNPILADIDGDGKVEAILGGNHGGLFAWELTPVPGDTFMVTPEKGWPLLYGENPTSVSVADVEADGFLEMAVSVDDGMVYLYDLPGLTSGAAPWPTAAHDNARTGSLGNFPGSFAPPDPNQDLTASTGANDVLLANPFRLGSPIRYRVVDPAEVEITIFDVMGRRVRDLVRGPGAGGIHQTTWDGRTDTGHSAPHGVYLLRCRIGPFEQTRRIVVAKGGGK